MPDFKAITEIADLALEDLRATARGKEEVVGILLAVLILDDNDEPELKTVSSMPPQLTEHVVARMRDDWAEVHMHSPGKRVKGKPV